MKLNNPKVSDRWDGNATKELAVCSFKMYKITHANFYTLMMIQSERQFKELGIIIKSLANLSGMSFMW